MFSQGEIALDLSVFLYDSITEEEKGMVYTGYR